LAVDFDKTLSFSNYPDVGDPNTSLFQRLINLQRKRWVIILWTCRCGEPLKEAVKFCIDNGLTPDYVNENAPEAVTEYGSDSRKVYADLYIDDKCCGVKSVERRLRRRRRRV